MKNICGCRAPEEGRHTPKVLVVNAPKCMLADKDGFPKERVVFRSDASYFPGTMAPNQGLSSLERLQKAVVHAKKMAREGQRVAVMAHDPTHLVATTHIAGSSTALALPPLSHLISLAHQLGKQTGQVHLQLQQALGDYGAMTTLTPSSHTQPALDKLSLKQFHKLAHSHGKDPSVRAAFTELEAALFPNGAIDSKVYTRYSDDYSHTAHHPKEAFAALVKSSRNTAPPMMDIVPYRPTPLPQRKTFHPQVLEAMMTQYGDISLTSEMQKDGRVGIAPMLLGGTNSYLQASDPAQPPALMRVQWSLNQICKDQVVPALMFPKSVQEISDHVAQSLAHFPILICAGPREIIGADTTGPSDAINLAQRLVLGSFEGYGPTMTRIYLDIEDAISKEWIRSVGLKVVKKPMCFAALEGGTLKILAEFKYVSQDHQFMSHFSKVSQLLKERKNGKYILNPTDSQIDKWVSSEFPGLVVVTAWHDSLDDWAYVIGEQCVGTTIVFIRLDKPMRVEILNKFMGMFSKEFSKISWRIPFLINTIPEAAKLKLRNYGNACQLADGTLLAVGQSTKVSSVDEKGECTYQVCEGDGESGKLKDVSLTYDDQYCRGKGCDVDGVHYEDKEVISIEHKGETCSQTRCKDGEAAMEVIDSGTTTTCPQKCKVGDGEWVALGTVTSKARHSCLKEVCTASPGSTKGGEIRSVKMSDAECNKLCVVELPDGKRVEVKEGDEVQRNRLTCRHQMCRPDGPQWEDIPDCKGEIVDCTGKDEDCDANKCSYRITRTNQDVDAGKVRLSVVQTGCEEMGRVCLSERGEKPGDPHTPPNAEVGEKKHAFGECKQSVVISPEGEEGDSTGLFTLTTPLNTGTLEEACVESKPNPKMLQCKKADGTAMEGKYYQKDLTEEGQRYAKLSGEECNAAAKWGRWMLEAGECFTPDDFEVKKIVLSEFEEEDTEGVPIVYPGVKSMVRATLKQKYMFEKPGLLDVLVDDKVLIQSHKVTGTPPDPFYEYDLAKLVRDRSVRPGESHTITYTYTDGLRLHEKVVSPTITFEVGKLISLSSISITYPHESGLVACTDSATGFPKWSKFVIKFPETVYKGSVRVAPFAKVAEGQLGKGPIEFTPDSYEIKHGEDKTGEFTVTCPGKGSQGWMDLGVKLTYKGTDTVFTSDTEELLRNDDGKGIETILRNPKQDHQHTLVVINAASLHGQVPWKTTVPAPFLHSSTPPTSSDASTDQAEGQKGSLMVVAFPEGAIPESVMTNIEVTLQPIEIPVDKKKAKHGVLTDRVQCSPSVVPLQKKNGSVLTEPFTVTAKPGAVAGEIKLRAVPKLKSETGAVDSMMFEQFIYADMGIITGLETSLAKYDTSTAQQPNFKHVEGRELSDPAKWKDHYKKATGQEKRGHSFGYSPIRIKSYAQKKGSDGSAPTKKLPVNHPDGKQETPEASEFGKLHLQNLSQTLRLFYNDGATVSFTPDAVNEPDVKLHLKAIEVVVGCEHSGMTFKDCKQDHLEVQMHWGNPSGAHVVIALSVAKADTTSPELGFLDSMAHGVPRVQDEFAVTEVPAREFPMQLKGKWFRTYKGGPTRPVFWHQAVESWSVNARSKPEDAFALPNLRPTWWFETTAQKDQAPWGYTVSETTYTSISQLLLRMQNGHPNAALWENGCKYEDSDNSDCEYDEDAEATEEEASNEDTDTPSS